MVLLVFMILCVLAAYSCTRYMLLKKAVKDSAKELHEISQDLEQNRIVKLPSPHSDMEGLLVEINANLEDIRRTRVKYEEKEHTLQKRIENISHDLRTPLTSILGFLDLIDENSLSNEDRESLTVVKRKARTLKKLIAQFYDLSRLTAGDYPMKLVGTDICRQLRETVLDSYQELRRKSLEVHLDIPENAVFVLADEEALERIFLNLLQNAGRYAQNELRICIREDEKEVSVFMENDTECLNADEVDALFDRFYTADSSRSEGSTGLGLPIAKYLAQEMGGKLSARMELGDETKWLQFNLQLHKSEVSEGGASDAL